MVTAERVYDNSFADVRRPNLRVASRQEQVNSGKAVAVISPNDKKRILITTVIVGIICVTMVIISAFAAQVRIQNNELIKANDAIQDEIDSLTVAIEGANSLQHIEKVAMGKLGMVYPTSEQCVYVTDEDVPEGDFATIIKENAYN